MNWNPPDTWTAMGNWLRGLAATLPRPEAVVVISGHWEAKEFTVQTNSNPELIYDYSGFPPEMYQLKYPAPGAPKLAADLGLKTDPIRWYDHGVFIPFKLIYPEADIPIVQVSLKEGLDAAEHIVLGEKLAGLREQGVLIVASGMSFHNLRAFGPRAEAPSLGFDKWLKDSLAAPDRNARLARWKDAPYARFAHPREEHLIPLMVAAGAAGTDPVTTIFSGPIMGATVSAFQFDRR